MNNKFDLYFGEIYKVGGGADDGSYDEGFSDGKAEGIEEGKSIGYADGYSKGEEAGFENGKDEGFKSGYSDGFVSGESHGYEKGYADGSKGDVDTVDLNLHLTSNGTFIYEKPEDKYYENIAIEVNVQSNEQTQEKTLNIDRNGTFEVVPDEGYSLEKVTVNATYNEEDMAQLFKVTTRPIEEWEPNTTFYRNIIKVECTKPYKSGRLSYLFDNMKALKTVDISLMDVSGSTSFDSTFSGCNSLEYVDVSNWDISNATSLYRTFYDCEVLQNLDVSKWDTSNCTSINGVFKNCKLLTSIDVSKWDTSNCTSLQDIFSGCTSLSKLDLSTWDTSKVTSMHSIFENSSLTDINLSTWDTSKVTSMSSDFFNGCKKLKNVVFGNNWGSNDSVKSITLNYAPISRNSCMDLVAKLADKSHLSSACQISLCSYTKGYLSADDLATLQSEFARKNWTVSWTVKW